MIHNPATNYELYFNTIVIISATDTFDETGNDIVDNIRFLLVRRVSGHINDLDSKPYNNNRYKSSSKKIIRRMILMLDHKHNGKVLRYINEK